MTMMKTISVTEFKAHCLELVNEVSRTGESVVLTKRGKPTAMVVPPPPQARTKWNPGRYEAHIRIVGDIIAPLDETWEALS
jgi:prevent-host-death family protein